MFDANTDFALGGFGGLMAMYSPVARTDGVLACGEGAVIIDHSLTFGGGGCGVATEMRATRYGGGPNDFMSFGYGGAIVRYHLFSRNVVNLGLGVLIGAGGVVINDNSATGSSRSDETSIEKSSEAVFVVEPQIGVYLNLIRWARVAALVGRRFVSGVDTKNMSNGDLSGITMGGAIQLGWF